MQLKKRPAFRRQGPAFAAAAVAVMVPQLCHAASPGVPPLGLWFNQSGKGGIETYMCGKYLCGRVVWLREPFTKSGKPMYDGNNPDPKRRTRLICGLTTISNLKPMTDGSWGDGQAYNPEEGKSYDVSVRMAGPDQLNVTGSVLFFSKTVHWKRAPADLPRCDAALEQLAAPAATNPKAASQPATSAPPVVVKATPPEQAPAAQAPANQKAVGQANAAPAKPAAITPARPVTANTKPSTPAGASTAKAAAPAAAKPAAAKAAVTPAAPAQKKAAPVAAKPATAAPSQAAKPPATAATTAKATAKTTAQTGAATASAAQKTNAPAAIPAPVPAKKKPAATAAGDAQAPAPPAN